MRASPGHKSGVIRSPAAPPNLIPSSSNDVSTCVGVEIKDATGASFGSSFDSSFVVTAFGDAVMVALGRLLRLAAAAAAAARPDRRYSLRLIVAAGTVAAAGH